MTESQATEVIALLTAQLWLMGLVGLLVVFLLAIPAARSLLR